MMKSLRILTSVLVAASVFGSCAKELTDLPDNTSGSETISFGVDGSFSAKVETKATEVTSLSSFYVTAVTGSAGSESEVWNSVQFNQVPGSSPATYTGNKLWPSSDPGYKFYGSNVALNFAAGGTYVNASNATDVVCAYLSSPTYKTKNTLTFEHIFARICTVTVSAEPGFTVSSVNIQVTPKTGGTYNIRTGAGHTDGTGWSALTTGSAVQIASSLGTNSNDVWLVPGIYSLSASWVATQAGGASVTYTGKTVDVAITGGQRNAISATLGGEIVFGVTVEPFDDMSVPVVFSLRQSSGGKLFGVEGGTESLTLIGYSGTWDVDYSTDGGATFSSTVPAGLSVSRTAADGASQTFAVTLAPATPAETGVTMGGWPSGTRYNTYLGSASEPMDLSLVDIHGESLAGGRSTANTYVVHTPGTYMIPLVYGNAIRDGAANTSSYITANSSSDIVSHFHNAYDTAISSPYIETDVAANGRTVSSASLIWSDVSGMVSVNSGLQTHGGIKYLVFSVSPSLIANGNAVLSVKDDLGDVVWSWLVWVTSDALKDETFSSRVSPFYEQTTFLSEAIGTIPPVGVGDVYDHFDCVVRFSTGSGSALVYSVSRNTARVYTQVSAPTRTVYYQFGRPVPAPSDVLSPVVSDGSQVSMATSLKHPETFYVRSESPWNWCSDGGGFYNVWNMAQIYADQDIAVVKTVYDPSPVGYSMPRRNAFTYFTTDAGNHGSEYGYYNVVDLNDDLTIDSGDFRWGWYMKRSPEDTEASYFPAAGYRSRGGGAVYYVGGGGYYWSSSPSSTDYGRNLYFYSAGLNPLSASYRANGFSVRPARIQ